MEKSVGLKGLRLDSGSQGSNVTLQNYILAVQIRDTVVFESPYLRLKLYSAEPYSLKGQANVTIRLSLIFYDFYLSTILFILKSEYVHSAQVL